MLRELMGRIYDQSEVESRIAEIAVTPETAKDKGGEREPGWGASLCDRKYRRSTFVAIGLAVFQQLCGINAFIFYSAQIMQSIGVSANLGVFLVNFANFIAVLPAIPVLMYYGRRTLMIIGLAVMCVALVIMTAFSKWIFLGAVSNVIQVSMLMLFVGAFEFSYGPILWLYLAEVCTDKGISLAILCNWTCSLLIGQLTPYFLQYWLHEYTFLLFGVFSLLGFIFVSIYMKETMGLSESECKSLYYSDDVRTA